jgi:hypothetical protein
VSFPETQGDPAGSLSGTTRSGARKRHEWRRVSRLTDCESNNWATNAIDAHFASHAARFLNARFWPRLEQYLEPFRSVRGSASPQF